MRREGFVSNRLFDVVAAGGRAISDDVAGIEEIFGEAVRTFTDTDELISMLQGDLVALFGPADEMVARGDRIRQEHSFDARAHTLIAAVMRRAAQSVAGGPP
ncbi:glycosyltransferase, partial [Microbacterium sp.]|uniref:glycosyltransferase n=1 Tax=Microbacterium sp. TaxID=51671 RepID=UPI00322216F1